MAILSQYCRRLAFSALMLEKTPPVRAHPSQACRLLYLQSPKKKSSTGWRYGLCRAWVPAKLAGLSSNYAHRRRSLELPDRISKASGLSGSVAQTIASGCTFEDAV